MITSVNALHGLTIISTVVPVDKFAYNKYVSMPCTG